MANSVPVRIAYRFEFDDGEAVEVEARLDGETLDLIQEERPDPPAWTELEAVGCSVCMLDATEHSHCPVALNLREVVERFGGRRSFERIKLTVTTEERTVVARTTLQHALSALTGIFMVSAGCPTMDQLRPMVRFHLPLATLQETTYRAASMYLLAQYLRGLRGLPADWSLDGLERIYGEVHQVNLAIARSIRNAASHDASANALVRLDLFTDGVAFSIRDALPDLQHFFAKRFFDDDPEKGG